MGKGSFSNECCETWVTKSRNDEIEKWLHLPNGSDNDRILSGRLRKLLPITNGTLQKGLAIIASMFPHSMQIERIVSHHNIVLRTENKHTKHTKHKQRHAAPIATNGADTAYYDLRPAVVQIISGRELRNLKPELDTNSKRKFVRKFFRQSGHF